ncbi:MAG TPA: hypothetical protein VF074_21440 [Pyrinomonadaceae bacterium]
MVTVIALVPSAAGGFAWSLLAGTTVLSCRNAGAEDVDVRDRTIKGVSAGSGVVVLTCSMTVTLSILGLNIGCGKLWCLLATEGFTGGVSGAGDDSKLRRLTSGGFGPGTTNWGASRAE